MEQLKRELRAEYRQKAYDKFEWLKSTKQFKHFQKALNLSHYSFVLSDPKYKNETLKLIGESYHAKNSFCHLFNMSQQDIRMALEPRVDFLCKTSRSIFAINKLNGKLEGGIFGAALCDHNEWDYDDPSFTENSTMKYVGEIMGTFYEKLNKRLLPADIAKILSNDIKTQSELRSLYRDYVYGGTTFTAKNTNSGLFLMLALSGAALGRALGCSYAIGEPTHTNMGRMSQMMGGKVLSTMRLNNFEFKDGTTFEYHMNKYQEKYGKLKAKKLRKYLFASIELYPILPDPLDYFKMAKPFLQSFKGSKL